MSRNKKPKHPCDVMYAYASDGTVMTMKQLFGRSSVSTVLKLRVDGEPRFYLCSRFKSERNFNGWRLFKTDQIAYAVELAQKHRVQCVNLA